MLEWKRLQRAAWASLAIHLIAGLAMAIVLRRGLETNPDLGDRLTFLAQQPGLWRCAWLPWNAAALSILYFFFALDRAHRGSAFRLALVLTAAGAVCDLTAEAIEMVLVPGLARRVMDEPNGLASFLLTHRRAVLLTGFLANGLYTTAVWAAVLASWKEYPRWVAAAGIGVGLAGYWLSAAAWVGSTSGLFWSNVVLVPCLLLWQAGMALDAGRRALTNQTERLN